MSDTDYPTMDSGHVPEAEVIWKLPAPKTSGFPDRCPCGGEIDPEIIELRTFFPTLAQLCTACYTVAQREDEARAVRDQENAESRHRLARLDATVPPEILATSLSHATFNKALYVATQAWNPKSGRWLFIHGAPGASKTRVVGLIVKKLILEGGRVVWTTAGKLQECVELLATIGKGAYRERQAALEEFRAWKTASILVLDDLGKNLWSPDLETRLFELIDHRKTHYLPTILTANSSLTELLREMLSAPRANGNRCGPIIGRIKEAAGEWNIDASPNKP